MIDLLIDPVTRLASHRHPFFGLYGSPLREANYPFCLKLNGLLDFGGYAEEERLNRINLRDKPIRVGEYVTYEYHNDVWNLKIVEVSLLANGQPA
jgi:hypothetical protein